MKKFYSIFLVSISIAMSAFAQDWEIYRSGDKDSELFIKAKDCSKARNYVDLLKQWKAKLGETTVQEIEIQNQDPGCTINITKHVPKFLEKYHGTNTIGDWGNCWGAALAASGMISDFIDTSTWPYGSEFWLKPPLCKELSSGEEPAPGDFGNIWQTGRAQDEHAFVYVGNGMAFSKNGASEQEPFKLQPLDDVLKLYLKEGWSTLKYYRCSTLNQYLEANRDIIPNSYHNYEKIISAFENTVRNTAITLNGPMKDLPSTAQDILRPVLTKTIIEITAIEAQLKKQSVNPDNQREIEFQRFLWGSLNFRLTTLGGFM
jgi:hypothetical protein